MAEQKEGFPYSLSTAEAHSLILRQEFKSLIPIRKNIYLIPSLAVWDGHRFCETSEEW
jgi:hypothetical protein